jgi:hypothetical protein
VVFSTPAKAASNDGSVRPFAARNWATVPFFAVSPN